METAERLFAQRGYDAVTLAEIRSAAGQHNASVIGYYFGSKEKLLEAVLEHRLPAVNAHRERMIGERRTADGRLTVRDALWCLVQPLADSVREGNHYVGLLDRLLDAEILGSVFGSADPTVTASGLAVDQALREALDDLRDEVRLQRIMMVYESALRTLARIARSSGSPIAASSRRASTPGWGCCVRRRPTRPSVRAPTPECSRLGASVSASSVGA